MKKQYLLALTFVFVFTLLFSGGTETVHAFPGVPTPGDITIIPLPDSDIVPDDDVDIYPFPLPGDTLDAVQVKIVKSRVQHCGVKYHQDLIGENVCLQEWCTGQKAGGLTFVGGQAHCDSELPPYKPPKAS